MNLKNLFKRKKTQEKELIPIEEYIGEIIDGLQLYELERVKATVEYEIEMAIKREDERKKEIEAGGLPF
jgi:hypothetical protein